MYLAILGRCAPQVLVDVPPNPWEMCSANLGSCAPHSVGDVLRKSCLMYPPILGRCAPQVLVDVPRTPWEMGQLRGPLGAISGPSWTVCGQLGAILSLFWSHHGSQNDSKRTQNLPEDGPRMLPRGINKLSDRNRKNLQKTNGKRRF